MASLWEYKVNERWDCDPDMTVKGLEEIHKQITNSSP